MMPTVVKEQAPVPPPSYQRAQARLGPALHLDALTLVTMLHLLTLCRLAVRLAHRRCAPPLPAGNGGARRTYSEESLLLISLLRTLWRLSYQDMHDWLQSWPALAVACGLPLDKEGQLRIPSKSQQCKRRHAAGAPLHESLFVLTVLYALRCRLIGARDSSLTALPSWPGDAVIPMLPLAMLPLTIPARCCWATGCIPSSVAVQVYLSFFCSLLPIGMMLFLLNPSWHGQCASTASVPVLSA